MYEDNYKIKKKEITTFKNTHNLSVQDHEDNNNKGKDYLLLSSPPQPPNDKETLPEPHAQAQAQSMLKLADIEETVRDTVTSAVDITVAKLARGIKATLEDFSNRITSVEEQVKDLKDCVTKLDASHETLRAGITTRFGKIEEDTTKATRILQSLKDKQDFIEAKGLLDTLSNKIAKDVPVSSPAILKPPESEAEVLGTGAVVVQQQIPQPQVTYCHHDAQASGRGPQQQQADGRICVFPPVFLSPLTRGHEGSEFL
eukprot:TRINITY_DN25277_c0_g1_i6.p1 TRINITY_DN25277_c0_g1~~TRINITY_DN25277_c0_g1_i6.p1  ORF type:complete len:257 (-),score=49.92 TRINITY_DN25277_c0_g1_i6:1240-2010(-)